MRKKAFLLPLLLLSLVLWVQPTTPISAQPVHDVAIVEVKTFSPAHGQLGWAYRGPGGGPPLTPVTQCYETWRVYINVTIINEGDFAESFNVTAYCNETAIGMQGVTDLAPRANITLTFIWNKPKYIHVWPYPVYYISAEASVVEGETDTADNSMINGSVKIKQMGDVNGDGRVNIYDLTYFALSFKKTFPARGYNPQCDFTGDGAVNIYDLTKLALYWKKGPLDPI